MIETIVDIEKGQYPFDEVREQGSKVRVQEKQTFQNSQELRQKKNQLIKKNKLIDSGFIIKLIKIYQDDLALYYVYEHVPFSIETYIKTFLRNGDQQIVEMSSKLFIKKITNELTVLISYLINMRIQIDLSLNLLGLTSDEKLKIFMSPRCRMGHKTELTLIPFYNIRKEKILKFLEQQLNCPKDQKKSLPDKKFTNLFSDTDMNESIYQDDNSNTSFNIDSSMCGTSIKQTTNSCLNQIQPTKSGFNSRKTLHNLGMRFRKKQHRNSVFSVDKGIRSHKNSFQFGNSRADDNCSYQDDDKEDARSYTHSRSIRIELQQNLDPSNKRKNRKDSYKIKVTSFHEYEMDDCDPSELLGAMPKNEEDIAKFFSKQSPSKSQKFTKVNQEEKFYQPQTPTTAPKKQNFVKKQSLPEQGYRLSNTTTAKTLQAKVKLAKEKAEALLKRYMKKTVSLNQDLDSNKQ